MKLKQKRTKPMQKVWYVLQPFVIYMIAKTLGMLLFSEACTLLFSEEIRSSYSSVVNAMASILGVSFVMKDFLIEVATTGEIDIDAPGYKRFFKWIKNGIKNNLDKLVPIGAGMSLAITSSLAFNIIISLLNISSEKYSNVENIQYRVPFVVGLFLYGIVSPWVEEIVFRGLIYNRMKRYYSTTLCIIATAVMFGCFHANIPQFIYGTCMGILIALCYEWTGAFGTAILFHMAANLFIYILSSVTDMRGTFVSPAFAIVFVVLSGVLTFIVWKSSRK